MRFLTALLVAVAATIGVGAHAAAQPVIDVPETVAAGTTVEAVVSGHGLGNEANLAVEVTCSDAPSEIAQTVDVVDGVAVLGPFTAGTTCIASLVRVSNGLTRSIAVDVFRVV